MRCLYEWLISTFNENYLVLHGTPSLDTLVIAFDPIHILQLLLTIIELFLKEISNVGD